MVDLLKRGRSILGRTEQEAAVTEYLKNGGINLDPATQAWCAAFVNATLRQEGLPAGKDVAMALSKYGDPVLTPRPGDVGVFTRDPASDAPAWQGHAAFYTGESNELGDPIILSGNANDSVLEHPIDVNRLVAWRRPPGVEEPPVRQSLLSPDVRERVAAVDFSRYGQMENPTRMNPGPYSAVDTVGGTTTPVLDANFKKAADNAQFVADLKGLKNKFIVSELMELHNANPIEARRLLERFRITQDAI